MFISQALDYDLQPYTVDVGSGMMKVGFSGDDAPRAVFPTLVGRPKNPDIFVGMDAKDCFVGDEAQAKRGILNLKNPIPKDHGTNIDFLDLEKIFHHSWYNEMCTTPEEHPLFITSLNPPGTNRLNSEKLTSIVFETINMPGLYICDPAVCAIYASGRATGCVLDVGYGKTLSQSIYEGLPIEYSRMELEDQTKVGGKRVSGCQITEVLEKLLRESGKYDVKCSSEKEVVRDCKEKLGFVSPDRIATLSIDDEMKKKSQENRKKRKSTGRRRSRRRNRKYEQVGMTGELFQEYELPDGSILDMDHERYLAPEILFRPKLIGHNLPGIHKLIQHSIEKCHRDMKRDLYQNIVLCGGSTMFEGLVERLDMEMNDLLGNEKNKYRVKINAPAERKYSPWIGGSIISSLSTMQLMWIVKDDYDEYGASIVHRMCPCVTRKNNQIGMFESEFFAKDLDEDERREYVMFQCFVGTRRKEGKEEILSTSFEEEGAEFLIKFYNHTLEIRFKSFLLL